MRSATVAVLAAVTASAYAAADRTTWTGEAKIEDPVAECEWPGLDGVGSRAEDKPPFRRSVQGEIEC